MNWRAVKLGDFLKVRADRFKPKDEAIQGLKRVDKIDFSGNIYLSNKKSNTDMILVKRGDLLISGINVEKGAVAVYEGQEDITATIHYSSYEFDSEKIDIDFLKLFLKSPEFLQAIKEQVPGGIKTEIKPKHLLPLEIIIPELDEQKKVVGKFSSFHSKQNQISTELNHQLVLIKELRRAYLREAMQGKLVPQDEQDEPAEILLEKIKAEKEKLAAGKRIKRDKPLPPINAEETPFEIPANWTWCRLGEIITMIYGSGLTKAQTKPNAKFPVFGSNGIVGFYDEFLTDKRAIIIGRKGSSGALNISEKPSWTTDVAYYVEETENLDFIFLYFLLSNLDLDKLGKGIKPGLNRTEAYNLIVALPPLAEQERIVAKLEKLMKFCDELEQNIKHGQEQTESLLQVSLKEALQS